MNNRPISVTDASKCCGCRACENVCPKDAICLHEDEYGFAYPVVDEEKCVRCGLCRSACHFEAGTDGLQQPLKALAAIHMDKKTLRESSSGGVFSALVEYTFSKSGAVCGCVLDDALRPVHVVAERQEDTVRMRGSKYAQSDIGLVYRDVKTRLKNGQFVLFTGTPCQVAGLYAVLGSRDAENLLTVDLVCHGVPSALMFQKYIEYLEQKYRTKIVDFHFRSKKYGWQRWTTAFTSSDGTVRNIGKIYEFFIPAFTTGNLMRPSCFVCPYATQKRIGDITVGDLWGQEKHHLSLNVDNGVSLCTLNTQAALTLLPVLEQKMATAEIDYQKAVDSNHCLHAPTKQGTKWQYYMDALKNDRIATVAQRYISSHKAIILRNKLKMLVPQRLFTFIRKRKYSR